MKLKTLFLMLFLLSGNLSAAPAEVIGTVYKIQEQSMLEFIMEKLQEKQASGEMEKMKQEFIKRSINSINNPKGTTLPPATKTQERIYDPTIILNKDLMLDKHRVLYHKGTKFNPLTVRGLSKKIIFIDGRVKEQVEFAVREHKKSGKRDRIVLVNGSYMELMKKHKVRFFFDSLSSQGGGLKRKTLVNQFGIKKLPSILYQKHPTDKFLTIREEVLP